MPLFHRSLITSGIILLALAAACVLRGCRESTPAPDAVAANGPSDEPKPEPIEPAVVDIDLPDIDKLAPAPDTAEAEVPTEWMFDTSTWERALSANGPDVEYLDPNEETDVVLLLRAGHAALRAKRTTRAIRCFRQAARREARPLDSLRGLALALTADGQYDRALQVYHRILQVQPEDRTARYNFAVACSRLGRRALAEKTYRRLLSEDSTDQRSRYNLACLLQRNGELAAARNQWTTLADQDPNSPEPWTAIGEIHLDLGEYDKATQAFAQAAQRDTTNPMAWLAFSDAARLSGSFGLAMAGATRAMRCDPNHPLPYHRLGKLQILVGRSVNDADMIRQGMEHCRRSLQLDPSQKELAAWIRKQQPTDP